MFDQIYDVLKIIFSPNNKSKLYVNNYQPERYYENNGHCLISVTLPLFFGQSNICFCTKNPGTHLRTSDHVTFFPEVTKKECTIYSSICSHSRSTASPFDLDKGNLLLR